MLCVQCDWPLPEDVPWEPADRCYHCAHPERVEPLVRTFHMQTNGGHGIRDEHGNPTMSFCSGYGPRRNMLPKGGLWCSDCMKVYVECHGHARAVG